MEKFHLALLGSQQFQPRSRLGGAAEFLYKQRRFNKNFLMNTRSQLSENPVNQNNFFHINTP